MDRAVVSHHASLQSGLWSFSPCTPPDCTPLMRHVTAKIRLSTHGICLDIAQAHWGKKTVMQEQQNVKADSCQNHTGRHMASCLAAALLMGI